MNSDTEPIDSRLRRALHRRADAVEPSPASYARLAERVSEDTSRARWWVAPRLWALGLASVVAIAAVVEVALLLPSAAWLRARCGPGSTGVYLDLADVGASGCRGRAATATGCRSSPDPPEG